MTGRGTEPFSGDTLHTGGPDRDVQRRVVATVTAALPEPGDYMPILRALLTPMRPAPAPHGKDRPLDEKEARVLWNARCRAWVLAQGRVPGREIRREDQLAYETDTGDRWELIKEGLR